jgi:hypothetical protein
MSFENHYKGERKQDWTTPVSMFQALHERFCFTLDGACTEENKLLERGSTESSPLTWKHERVFCNPPWTSIAKFIEQAPNAVFACFLVPARCNAKWFHRALELGARVDFFLGRPKFGNSGKGSCPFDCCLLLFGNSALPPWAGLL